MSVERLFGDYTLDGFRDLVRQEYTRETGRKARGKNYQIYVENLLNEAVSKLYDEKARTNGRDINDLIFFNRRQQPLNLIGKEEKKSNKKN